MLRSMIPRRAAALIAPAFLLLASCSLEELVEPDTGEPLWEDISGPGMRDVETFAISEGAVLAGFFYGGVYRSEDDGQSWEPSSEGLIYEGATSLAAGAGPIVYAGTQEGLCRSFDGGRTWTEADTAVSGGYIHAVETGGDGFVWVSIRKTSLVDIRHLLVRSSDHGETWSDITDSAHGLISNILLTESGDLFAGATDGRIFRSEDAGGSWIRIGLETDFEDIFCMTESPEGDIWVASYEGIFRSDDRGESWTAIAAHDEVGYILGIDFDMDGRIYAAGRSGVFRSTDDGASWESVPQGMTNRDARAVIAVGEGRIYAGTSMGSIFRSLDGGDTWNQANETGIPGGGLYDIACGGDGLLVVGSTMSGIFRSTDDGRTWQNIDVGRPRNQIHSVVFKSGILFAGANGCGLYTDCGGVWRSTDGGLKWTQTGFGGVTVWRLAVSTDGGLFAGTAEGLFRSGEDGASWERIDPGWEPVKHVLSTKQGHALVADGGILHRSTDNGATWESAGRMGLGEQYYIIAATESRGYLFVLDKYYGIFRSRDGGSSWEHVLAPAIPVAVPEAGGAAGAAAAEAGGRRYGDGAGFEPRRAGTFLTIASGPDDCLFVGTRANCIFYSNDGGDSWHSYLFEESTYAERYRYFTAFAFDPAGRVLAVWGQHRVLRSILPIQ